MNLIRLALALSLILAGASSAGALVCPLAKELKQHNGWWTAPGGWRQRSDYKPPIPAARVSEFTGASYEGDFRGPGRLMCQYLVEGQPGVDYTLIFHPTKGGPMDYDWDCPPLKKDITCTCVGLKPSDCEVRD